MLTPAEALARILASAAEVAPLPAERVPLAEAAGRALARPLLATRALPPFPAATMDGYALRACDAPGPGARLPVAFEVAAGHPSRLALPPGACCRIFTGAPLPRGADAVEMQEQVAAARDGGGATFGRAALAGRFVRPAGDDVARGGLALPGGAVLDPGAIGLAAALGHASLLVRRRPRVVILPTGDEVVALGGRPGPGQLFESNGHALAAAVALAGGLPEALPAVGDDPRALRAAVRRARGADLLVTTGGVSVGDRDLTRQALAEAGARLDFWRVAMRPGKPLAFGRLGRTLVFGLPGNPAAALVTFELFARPALRRLAGLPLADRVVVRGRLAEPQEKPLELTVYLRVRAVRVGRELVLQPLRTQASGNLTSAAGVGGLAVLPAGRRRLARGAPVDVILLRAPDAEP
ncbi:MAG: molybdopterin molybdotransferase MoeA [Anaeromyxobacter sp.]|nr:molybdopterin molybdotransferase MoeA [Anaeromyxobacter sp.]MBL0274737.1 molybdopterin molybdotransferase MoeA [Anaeromyxobacter sp.]